MKISIDALQKLIEADGFDGEFDNNGFWDIRNNNHSLMFWVEDNQLDYCYAKNNSDNKHIEVIKGKFIDDFDFIFICRLLERIQND